MHRYEELEKLYYRNKIKKYTLITVFVFVSALGIYFGIGYLSKPKHNLTQKINVDFKKITSTKPKSEIKEKNVTKNSEKVAVNAENKKTLKKLSEKNTSIDKSENTNANSETSTPNLSFVVPKIKPSDIKAASQPIQQKQAVVKNKPAKEIKTVSNSNKIQIIPQIKEETINIKDLINSFNQEPSYDTAIVISNYYYEKNDLNNAKLWALKANNIDPSKYQSWKMFALILLKKNDKIKAKEVLKIYLNDYGNNDEIYKLLRSIDE